MKVVSIQVGKPQSFAGGEVGGGRPWSSGIIKHRVEGPVQVDWTNLAGDGQADLVHHGGPDKAINAYPSDHWAYWRDTCRLTPTGGSFGENFTTQGADETQVCIGDVYRIGTVLVQVSQPRQPCWKLDRRWQVSDLAKRVQQTGRTGWYFRVVQCGTLEAPADLVLVERPHPEWTVARANQIMHHDREDRAAAAALAACPALSQSWKTTLRGRTEGVAETRSSSLRLDGPS